jgi:hypothetical protein
MVRERSPRLGGAMTFRRFLPAALLSGAALLLPTAAAQADVLSAGGHGLYPDVTAQAGGGFRVVWSENITASPVVREAAGAGPFGAAGDVIKLTARDRFPFAAADAHGGVAVVWQRSGPPYRRARFAIRRADGTLTPARTLSPGGHSATIPSLAGNAAGAAVACWRRYDGAAWQPQCAIRKPGADAFGPAVTLAGGAAKDKFAPVAAVSPGGRLAVVYETGSQVLAAVGSVDGGLGQGRVIGAHQLNYAPASVAVAGDGSAMALWSGVDSPRGSQHSVVSAVRLAPDGTASPAQPLGSPGGIQPAELAPPAVTALSDSGYLAGWASGKRMFAAHADPGGTGFGAPAPVGDVTDFAWAAKLAAGPDGSAVLAWTLERPTPDNKGLLSVVELARYAGGAWSEPKSLSDPSRQALAPTPALAPDGTAAVAWVQTTTGGGEGTIQATTTH